MYSIKIINKFKHTKVFIIINMTYYDWCIEKVVLIMDSCENNVVSITQKSFHNY
jgi:hypothetical protein